MSLMMSSCWTLRLNRRSALSIDSPSCTLTSATRDHTPFVARWPDDVLENGRMPEYARLSQLRRCQPRSGPQSFFRKGFHHEGSGHWGGCAGTRPLLALRPELGAASVLCAPGNAGIAARAVLSPVDAADPAPCSRSSNATGRLSPSSAPSCPLTRGVVEPPRRRRSPGLRPNPRSRRPRVEQGLRQGPHGPIRDSDGPPRGRAHRQTRPWRSSGAASGIPVVLKADGLAAGKGVVIADTAADAEAAVHDMMVGRRFGDAGARLVIEEFLRGPRSVVLRADRRRARAHPALGRGSQAGLRRRPGPNTGGMGAFSPSPLIDDAMAEPRARRDRARRRCERWTRKGVRTAGSCTSG